MSKLRYDLGLLLVLALLGGFAGPAAAAGKTGKAATAHQTCQKLPQDLLAGDGVYFGETHGTREMPELLMCFVRQAMTQSRKPIVVSLEFSDEHSPSWAMDWAHPSDGRTSEAMAKLITDLRKLHARTGRVSLAYQTGCPTDGIPSEAFDNRCMAEKIKAAMATGFVIAYSGNSHAARLETPWKSAAALLPASVKTVEILFSNNGSAWGAYNGGPPGPSPVPGRSDLSGISGFIPGKSPGFDYAYVIKDITPSFPANKAP